MNLWVRGETWASDIWKALQKVRSDDVAKVTGVRREQGWHQVHHQQSCTPSTHISNSSRFSLILLPWPPKVLPSTPQIQHDASFPIHSNIKLGSTLNSSSSSFRHDLVSLTSLFIHWSTMGELMVNPCRHSHHGSTNVLEFSLPFFPDTFSSGLLFWGHATPLKKNTKQFVRKLFPRNIKNLLWLHILDHSVFSLGCHP